MKDKIRAEINRLTQEWNSIKRKAAAENRTITEGERLRGESIVRELNEQRAQLERLEAYDQQHKEELPPAPDFYNPGGVSKPTPTPVAGMRSARWEDLFPQTRGDNWGCRSFGQFVVEVTSGRGGQLAQRALNTGIPADGGWLVPPDFARELLNVSLEREVVRPRARIYPMIADAKTIPGVEVSDLSSGSYFGGVQPQWKAELGTLEAHEPKFRSIQLTAHKLTCFGASSREWADDGVEAAQAVFDTFGGAISYALDRDFLVAGTGAGRPLSILNAACTYEQGKETAQSAATVVYENLAKMLSRLHPASWSNAVWVCHPSVVPQLLTLSLSVGTGGSAIPVFNESAGTFRILGKPAIISDKLNTLGTAGDIMLADFTQYAVGVRADVRFDSSQHLYFDSDRIAWRMVLRIDGQPLWDKTFKDPSGRESAPFVTLATRS